METIKMFQLAYYKHFRCTGSDCKNNCCHHWKIGIDKTTYDKYMSLPDDEKTFFEDKIGYDGNDTSKPYFKLQSNGNCSFVDEKGLCTIQLKYGHDYLSDICRNYPRIACIVGGSPEAFLELSCEVAAKLILFDKNYMNFEEVSIVNDINDSSPLKYTYALDTEKYTSSPHGYDIFWKLRVLTVAILQTRKYRIRFRMLLLCMLIQDVVDLIAAGQDFKIIALADDYSSRLDQNYYDELSASMPYGTDREFDVILDVMKEIHGKQLQFKNIIDTAKKGLDIAPDVWEVPEDFSEKFTKYYEMYLVANEHIFENYLVHRVLSEGFPFNYKNEKDIMGNYVDLFAKFNIVEFLTTGICRNYSKFDKRHIVDCISLFTRGYDHSLKKFFISEDQ